MAPFRTWAKAARDIQSAIDAADAGDTVLVTNGTYATGSRTSGGILGNRVVVTNAIVVESVNGPDHTTIQGRSAGQHVDIRCAYVGHGARLAGFTLAGGWTGISGDYERDQSGGGVWCETDATVSNCVIRDNWAPNYGGGAYRGALVDCVLAGNTGGHGGGAALATLDHCVVSNNSAFTFGGGGAYGCTILDSWVVENTATWAGGGMQGGTARNSVFMGNSAFQMYGPDGWGGGAAYGGMVENCVVVGNASAYGGGVAGTTVRNSIVYFNQATLAGDNYWECTLSYCCAYPEAAGAGNITNDPGFVDYAAGDFRLKMSSPCINAGTNLDWMTNAVDLAGTARILNQRVDIGAYETVFFSPEIFATFLQNTTARFVVTGVPLHSAVQYRWVETSGDGDVDYGWVPLDDTHTITLEDVTPTFSHTLSVGMLEGANRITLTSLSWTQRRDMTTHLLFPRIDAPPSTNAGGEVLASTTLLLGFNLTGRDRFYISGVPNQLGGGGSLPEGFKILANDQVIMRGPVASSMALDISSSVFAGAPNTFTLMTTNGGDPGPFYLILGSPVGIDQTSASFTYRERNCWELSQGMLNVYAMLGPSWASGPLTITALGYLDAIGGVVNQGAGNFAWSRGWYGGAPSTVTITWMYDDFLPGGYTVVIPVTISPEIIRHVQISPKDKTAYIGGPETNVTFTANNPPGATNWTFVPDFGDATMIYSASTGAVVNIGTVIGSYEIGASCALHPDYQAASTLVVRPPLIERMDYYDPEISRYTNMPAWLYLRPGARRDFRAVPVITNALTLSWLYTWGGAAVGRAGRDVGDVLFPAAGPYTVSVEGGNILSNFVEAVDVDILQSETNTAGYETNVLLTLTSGSYSGPAGVTWASVPEGLRGVGSSMSNFWFNPSLSDPNTYTVTATANGLTTCYDTCTVRVPPVLKVELIPDYDRSGVIDDADRAKADAGDKFYFWVNDDDDSGFEDDTGAGKMDIPGAVSGWLEFDGRTPDYDDLKVDGERDWVDFFPVFVDSKPTLDLIGTSGYKYVLKHTAGAVNAYIPNDLGPSDAAKHLRDYTYAHNHADASLHAIPTSGYELPTAFLNAVQNDGKGVILLEGKAASTTGKLVLEVQKSDGTVICSHELPLSLDGVEKMFLHKNLRTAGGGSGGEADRTTAPNYPDSLCNGKQFVFIHGYNVNSVQARGWAAETFKRMYWAHNNARFHAITWHGDESQSWAWYWPWWGYVCPNYHNNVVNAWKTAPAVKNYLAGLSGNVYLSAHSLGNMVASCALMIDSSVATKYFMLDAAIASEAFDPSQFNENMLHSNWIPYESLTDLYASEWHSIFGSGDQRSDLTWQGRFSSIASKCINLYSSGDQVFDVHPKATEPDVFEVMPHVRSGRYSWAFQEKRKGSNYKPGGDAYTFSSYAGWSFNDQNPPAGWTYQTGTDPDTGAPIYSLYTPAMAAGITTSELVTKPFFGMGTGDFRNNLFTTDTATANTWLTEENRWRVIAGTIPAMSLAVGRTGISTVPSANINAVLKPSYWPDRGGDTGTDWLHSDIRNMAYLYTFNLFDYLVAQGGLE